MKDSITRCQICKKIVTLEKNSKTEKVENVNGVSWPDFVYSPRGWGRAQVAVNAFRGEICDDCFIPIKNKLHELNETVQKRKDLCKDEGICIYKTSSVGTGGYKMPSVQLNELQSKRYPKPILWLLSHFS